MTDGPAGGPLPPGARARPEAAPGLPAPGRTTTRSRSTSWTTARHFAHFLKFYYPELPPRRAFFLAQGTRRVVYTYSSPRLEEDLRHEATHALLRGAFGDLPLWLDEGLAEYFETDLSQPGRRAGRASTRSPRTSASGWSPNLERLESLTDIRQMTPRDYREAWAWVHLLLNGPDPGRSILMGYLGESGRKADKVSLSSRLTPAGVTNDRLLAYLKALRAGCPRSSVGIAEWLSPLPGQADRASGPLRTTRALAASPAGLGSDRVSPRVRHHCDYRSSGFLFAG